MTQSVDPRAFAASRRDDLVELVRALVAIDSVTGREAEVARFVAAWLERRGVTVRLQEVDPAHPGRCNLFASAGAGARTLVLSGHLDTVPADTAAWTVDPWRGALRDGRVFGLGSSDMKTSLAAACVAAERHAALAAAGRDAGRLVLAFTVAEETDGSGTRAFLDRAARERSLDPAATEVVVMEPTGLDHVVTASRGAAFLDVRIDGLGGHGSRPHLARNPIAAAARLLESLPRVAADWNARYPDAEVGGASITPTSLAAGDALAVNVIPRSARLVLDCRLTAPLYRDGLAQLRREAEALVAAHARDGFTCALEIRNPREGARIDRAHPLALRALAILKDDLGVANAEFRATPASNDASFFAARGFPTLVKVGPGHPEQAHRADESVDLEQLVRGAEFFARLADAR